MSRFTPLSRGKNIRGAEQPGRFTDLRVLTVGLCAYSREGGIERHWRLILRSLDEQVASGEVAAAESILLYDNIGDVPRSLRVRIHAFDGNKLRGLTGFIRSIVGLRPDIVMYAHLNLAPMVMVGGVLAPKARHYLFVYGSEAWREPSRITRKVVRSLVDRIVVISRTTRERMASVYGLRIERFIIVPCAISSETPARYSQSSRVTTMGSPSLLSVGRLVSTENAKNVGIVIEAIPQLCQAHPNLHYHIIGSGDSTGALLAMASRLGVDSRVHIRAGVSDAERDADYASADIFVFPSTTEGFGIVILEAWSQGLPVIVANEGGPAEIVRHGVDGLCVAPTAEGVREGIALLSKDYDLRRRMGASGYERISREFSFPILHANIQRLLSEP